MHRRLALVTGASAGIGAALARSLAARGYDLALTARRQERLDALADELRLRFGAGSLVIPEDLADPAAPARLLAAVEAAGRDIDVLVNNAGYGLPGIFVETGWQEQADFLQVMLHAPTELTHRLLPGMTERRFGRILNVASLAGLLPGARGHTLYAATKAYLIRFSQSLHLETTGSGVQVSALCPGFTWSEFHDVNGTRETTRKSTPDWLWMGADEVAEAGLEALEANRPVCVPGAPNKAIALAAKLIPDEWILALMASQGSRFRQP
jgi:short-subunit dehydrogenase